MKSEKDGSGSLVFDIPRYRIYMGFEHDWPRMNTLPEWFTVEPGERHLVEDVTGVHRRRIRENSYTRA